MKLLVSSLFCFLCSIFLFSCGSDDYNYTPPEYHLFSTDVLLSIETSDGKLYEGYETLLKNKQISMRGVASRSNLPLKIVEDGGIKYLQFYAELPNRSDMKYSKVDEQHRRVTGSSDVILKIDEKEIRLTCFFEGGEFNIPMYADPVICVTAIQYGDRVVKRDFAATAGKYKITLRKKADSDDFILTD